MSLFTTIAFGMCAYLATGLSANHQTMMMIGNIENGVCNPFLFFTDSYGQKTLIGGHTYGLDVYDGGATLYFDDKVFHFVKDSI